MTYPDDRGYYGDFGGRFVPEALVAAIDELAVEYDKARVDPNFIAGLEHLLHTYVGRPTPLTEGTRLREYVGGMRVLLKREDLCHTGSHKLNNALGQVLLAKRMGKTRIIAETGAGQHGVATATACAYLGLECVVYMGEEDTRRQALNVARMRMLGTTVVPVTTGSKTLKDAINEAMRDWVTNVDSTHYVIGSVMGPHPFPMMVRDFQRVIGVEARQQCLELTGALPDVVIACVGGGSNAMGSFHAFIPDSDVELVGVEAGGEGISTGQHAATVSGGRSGVIHGMRTLLLQDEDGQTMETHSISAGLDYPGVGPEHAWLHASGRATYRVADDADAMSAMRVLAQSEGILPAIETAHAFAGLFTWAADQASAGRDVASLTAIVTVSGRGDKDMETAARWFDLMDHS